jgi:hypothetical protein
MIDGIEPGSIVMRDLDRLWRWSAHIGQVTIAKDQRLWGWKDIGGKTG